MKIKLIKDIASGGLMLIGDDGEYYDWSDICVSLGEIIHTVENAGAGLCMDSQEDRERLISLLLEEYNHSEEEEEEMQEVPDDSVILTEDEARAILNASLGEQFDKEDFDAAVSALDEQLEYEDTEEEY